MVSIITELSDSDKACCNSYQNRIENAHLTSIGQVYTYIQKYGTFNVAWSEKKWLTLKSNIYQAGMYNEKKKKQSLMYIAKLQIHIYKLISTW